ncbi:SDR family oxidoreductase [Paeniglutamicibacter sp. ORCA_105]|uniref:SDR family oxidoreductase n=1 Tax=Paeniglutamicibacter sp. ORCA_105 TaxID=3377336 RepID=UPI0038957E21
MRCDPHRRHHLRPGQDDRAFGGLDVAFNHAGIEQPMAPLADIAEEPWDRLANVGLRSVFLCMKHQSPLMPKTGGGRS